MKNFNRGGRGMAVGQSDKVTQLRSDGDLSRRPTEENKKYLLPSCRPLHCGRGDGRVVKLAAIILPMIIFCVLFSVPDLLGTSALAQSQHRDKGPLASPVHGQEATGLKKVQPLLIGSKVPDEFWTKEHLFYVNGDTIRMTLEDYKGKILVLDFWATWCANCIGSMKKTQELFAKYPEDALVLFVNPAQTKDNYTKILAKQDVLETNSLNGSFSSIIEDELIQQLFPNHIYPRYVWISPFGNLMAQTTALSVTDGHLTDMINILKQFHGKE